MAGNLPLKKDELPEMKMPERFRRCMLDGTKLSAVLPEPWAAAVGTHFAAFGCEYTIIDVGEISLGLAAACLYRSEGFETREAFIESWCEQYPNCGYRPDQSVYVHLFVKARSDAR